MRKQRRFPRGICALSVMLCVAGASDARSGEAPLPKAVATGFTYTDTSGEERDQTAAHAAFLKNFNEKLREGLGGAYRLVPLTCGGSCPSAESNIAGLVAEAQQAGANYLMFGGIQKTSTLVQWAEAVVVDLRFKRVIYDRLLTFRGDDADAWQHAAAYIARELVAARGAP